MTANSRSTASLSNASRDPLSIWIERWCDKLDLAPRSLLSIEVEAPDGHDAIAPAVELDGDMLVVWATCPGTMTVTIDGIVQDTGSRTIDLSPDLFDMPVKNFVGFVFGPHPHARPGGAPAPPKRSLWHRLLHR